MCKMPLRCNLRICCAIAAVFAALAGAIFNEHVAYAQGGDNDYVDVVLTLEVPRSSSGLIRHQVKIILENKGARPAYDVEVIVAVESPENSHFPQHVTTPPVGSLVLGNDVPWDEQGVGRSLRWTVPVLAAQQREEFTATVAHKVTMGPLSPPAPVYDNTLFVHRYYGVVTTSSFESSLHKENNTSRVWSYSFREAATVAEWYQVLANYLVSVSVDNPSPSPGETVNFTITGIVIATILFLGDASVLTPPPVDAKVYIELTDGLAVDNTGKISYAPAGTTGLSYNDGVFDIGKRKVQEQETVDEIRHSVTLPVRVNSNAAVNSQCLRATITGNPLPDPSLLHYDDLTDNVAELCLGTGYFSSPLLSSQVDAINIYPCVGNTDWPCDSTDDVRVRAAKLVPFYDSIHKSIRRHKSPLDSGRTLVHVPDLPNRKYDSSTSSVNDGDTVSWHTPVILNITVVDNESADWCQ